MAQSKLVQKLLALKREAKRDAASGDVLGGRDFVLGLLKGVEAAMQVTLAHEAEERRKGAARGVETPATQKELAWACFKALRQLERSERQEGIKILRQALRLK